MPSSPAPEAEIPQLTASPPRLPVQKLGAFARFKSLTGSLSLKNTYTKSQDEIVFPPPSWFINEDMITPSIGGVSNEPMRHSPLPEAQPQRSDSDRAAEMPLVAEAPEPVSLAMKIRQLINSLPLPTITTKKGTLGFTQAANKGPAVVTGNHEPDDFSAEILRDGEGPPIPTVVDANMVELLSSESVMNGDTVAREGDQGGKGSYRQSVWSVLERLRSGRVGGEGTERKGEDTSGRDLEGGIMMYSPLEPTPESEVELAESVEPLESHGSTGAGTGKGKGKEQPSGSPPVSKVPVPEKIWVPSTTKLSLYTTWWGYRLYLPPPIMEKLGSTHVKATARAAMITTALKWFLDRLPLMMVPPALKPTVVLLKRLSPLIGYIGVFIAWSWSRITTYDEGGLQSGVWQDIVADCLSLILLKEMGWC